MALIHNVWSDIEGFLNNNTSIFFNERDLQMHLAVFLKQQNYDVDVEYRITKKNLTKYGALYPWDENVISIDIVVSQDGVYVPIELKFKTRMIKNDSISTFLRFGEATSVSDIVRNQSAQDLGRYGFWKDVKRLELIKDRFKRVDNGIVIFLTNDDNYVMCPKAMSVSYNYEQFSMTSGLKKHLTRHWSKSIPKSCPDFEINKTYDIYWEKPMYLGEQFYYCMLKV